MYKLLPKALATMFLLLFMNLRSQTNDNALELRKTDINERLAQAVEAIESDEYGEVHSLLVYKNDELILEQYFNGWQQDSLHMLQSVTKSFVATLMGIAIQEGFVKDVDQRVLSYFPNKAIAEVDEWKKKITIEDLLTQRHGLQWKESPWNAPDNSWRKILETDGDWFEMILSTPMSSLPGTHFNYSNAAPVLISGIIQQASVMAIDAFAQKYLFEPLGIEQYRFWEGNGGASNNGSALLFLTPRDMLKIGQLYLDNGRWKGKQILPEHWVRDAARTSQIESIRDNRFYRFGYGYFWWNTPKALGANLSINSKVYVARGAGGQYIIVDPIEEVVVVITAWDLRRANYIFDIFPRFIQSQEQFGDTLNIELFASEILTPKVEFSPTLSPDGKHLFFAKNDSFYAANQKSTIYQSNLVNGLWSPPEITSFSGQYSDSSPFVTPDGKRIYFSSNRPVNGLSEKPDTDIWYVERQGEGWSQPIHESIFNSDKSEFSPTLDKNGNIYFGSYRDGGKGSGDIWVSLFDDGVSVSYTHLTLPTIYSV